MDTKQVFQSLIALKQREMPFDLIKRDLELPVHSGKIITVPGVRRCGKSSLMTLAINRLLEEGIAKERILWIGFDDERLVNLSADELNTVITAYMEMSPQVDISTVYMFFDEIQNIEHWELFIIRLYKSYCKNIFISGSNAGMLSAELATSLRGWPIEYEEFPLSFAEYCRFKQIDTHHFLEADQARLLHTFKCYNQGSAFPEVVQTPSESMQSRLLQGYFNAMLFRDLVERYDLGNVGVVKYFIKRVMNNLTKPTSINGIYNDLKSQGYKVGRDRLYELADQCCSIFLFFRVGKYETSMIKEKSSLPKYYMVDNGMRQAVVYAESDDHGKLLENSVFLHLRRHNNEEGAITYFNNGKECDFVVKRQGHVEQLIQVTWSLGDEKTKEREITGLLEAAKATRCSNLWILTCEEEDTLERDGNVIKIMPAWKWMLADSGH